MSDHGGMLVTTSQLMFQRCPPRVKDLLGLIIEPKEGNFVRIELVCRGSHRLAVQLIQAKVGVERCLASGGIGLTIYVSP